MPPPARDFEFLWMKLRRSMALRFFTIPVNDAESSEQEINQFLAGHKVVSIERHLIDVGKLERFSPSPSPTEANPGRSRPDKRSQRLITPRG